MTTAIDRFLYRATADTVVTELEDARGELAGAFEELETFLDKGRTCALICNPHLTRKQERAQVISELLQARNALLVALEAAEAHVADFVEANRP